jgi:hypothetical protein
MRGEDGLVESRLANVTLRSRGTDSPATVVGLSDCAEVQADRAVSTRTVGSTEHHKNLGPFHVKHHLAAHRDRPGGRRISRRATRPALKPARLILHPSPRNDWRSTTPWRVATAYTATGVSMYAKAGCFTWNIQLAGDRGISAPEPAVPGSSRAERAPPVLRRAPRSGGTS